MKALIHLDPQTQDVVGVWTGPEDMAYVLDRDYERQLGIDTMDKRIEPNWDAWCDYLTDRTPVSVWWSVKEVKDGSNAASVLAELSSK